LHLIKIFIAKYQVLFIHRTTNKRYQTIYVKMPDPSMDNDASWRNSLHDHTCDFLILILCQSF